MLIRRLVIASLVAGAASAQAGNIATPATQPSNVVSAWTAGNGTDVLGSGVLQGNVSLVAGVSHTADASLSDILYGKVAGSAQQVNGQIQLFFQRGIEANYLLASGHGILAAGAGLGRSVVGSADGAIISDGMAKVPGLTGGGNNVSNGAPSGDTGGASGNAPVQTSTGGQGGTSGTNTNTNTSGELPGQGSGAGNGIGNGGGIGNGALNGTGDGIGSGSGSGLGNVANQQVVAVPEPSSIALMLLGMVGAGALSRRRSR